MLSSLHAWHHGCEVEKLSCTRSVSNRINIDNHEHRTEANSYVTQPPYQFSFLRSYIYIFHYRRLLLLKSIEHQNGTGRLPQSTGKFPVIRTGPKRRGQRYHLHYREHLLQGRLLYHLHSCRADSVGYY